MIARGITMIDAIQGPPRWAGPDVLLRQTSFRALAEPRRFRDSDGTVTEGSLRVRFGEVEARGRRADAQGPASATTPRCAAARPGRRRGASYFPATDAELAADGLAYYRGGDPDQTRCLRGLPAQLRRRASSDPTSMATPDGRRAATTPTTASTGCPAPSAITSTTLTTSTRKRHHDHHDKLPPSPPPTSCATGCAPRCRPSAPLSELGEPGAAGVPASTPITGDVLFTVAETTAAQTDEAIAAAARGVHQTWRLTPAPVRGALVARLGELLDRAQGGSRARWSPSRRARSPPRRSARCRR